MLATVIIAPLLIFVFTIVLTIAGLGAAFIVIPTLYYLNVPLKEAMAIGLLLNAISMVIASYNYARYRLIDFKAALSVIIVGVIFSPMGAYSTKFFSKQLLLALFVLFLLFAGSMMLFYKPKPKEHNVKIKDWQIGSIIGVFAGYLGGLLGVGGGNFIVPGLIWSGFDAKKASGTTAFIVIFLSFSGFLGHLAVGNINIAFLAVCILASILGAIAGSFAMTKKLNAQQVKKIIAFALYLVALKMIIDLIKII